MSERSVDEPLVVNLEEANPPRNRGDFVIPAMTSPLSKGWEQPEARDIVFAKAAVYMSRPTWEKLAKYDHSMPSGVYEGKMWRAWQQLRWYGPSPTPDTCSINSIDAVVCDTLHRADGRVCLLRDVPYPTPPWAICDGWFALSHITDKIATCLACLADGGKRKPSGLRCSLCSAPVGTCSHTRKKP